MHLGRSTVTGLIEELEGCDPHVEVRLATSPPGRSSTRSTPATPPSRSIWTTPSVLYISEGEQLDYLPGTARQVGW
jgi:hypothetical protein